MKDTDRHPNLIDRLRHRGGEASPAHHVSSADQERPAVDIVKEIRFAVVMYGGVSLAIYINGVAQELLSLVRATAAGIDDQGESTNVAWLAAGELRGAERVYRDIALHLSRRYASH